MDNTQTEVKEKMPEGEYAHASNVGGFLEYDKSDFETEVKPSSTIKTVLTSLLASFLVLVIVFQILLVFTPATLGRTFFTMGFYNAGGYFYTTAYNRSLDDDGRGEIKYIANALDNYIHVKNHQKITRLYPNEMYKTANRTRYDEYVRERNARESKGDYAYVTSFNYDNYIKSNYVKSLFIQGQVNGAFAFAYEGELGGISLLGRNPYVSVVNGQFKYSFVFAAFIREFVSSNNDVARGLVEANIGRIDTVAFELIQHMELCYNIMSGRPYDADLAANLNIPVGNLIYFDADIKKLGRADIKNRGVEVTSVMYSLYTHLQMPAKVTEWNGYYGKFQQMTVT